MYQHWLIDCKKCTALMCVCTCTQFFCKPKDIKSNLKQNKTKQKNPTKPSQDERTRRAEGAVLV